MSSRSQFTDAEWEAEVKAHIKSGLSLEDYCRGKGFSSSRLSYWRVKLGYSTREATASPPSAASQRWEALQRELEKEEKKAGGKINVSEFCRQRGVKPTTFQMWRLYHGYAEKRPEGRPIAKTMSATPKGEFLTFKSTPKGYAATKETSVRVPQIVAEKLSALGGSESSFSPNGHIEVEFGGAKIHVSNDNIEGLKTVLSAVKELGEPGVPGLEIEA